VRWSASCDHNSCRMLQPLDIWVGSMRVYCGGPSSIKGFESILKLEQVLMGLKISVVTNRTGISLLDMQRKLELQ
jgi:hypothetical protein